MRRSLVPAAALVAVVLVAAGALIAGCEVSFFGNDPVVLAGTSTNTEGSEAQACSEPDAACTDIVVPSTTTRASFALEASVRASPSSNEVAVGSHSSTCITSPSASDRSIVAM